MRWLSLALVLAGCQAPTMTAPDPLIWVSWSGPVLDARYLPAAEEAVRDWNTILDRPVFSFGRRWFVSVDLIQVPHLMDGSDGVLAAGRAFPSRRLIAVSTAIDPGTYRAVVTHELGHILGLTHSDQPGDVMFSHPNPDARLTLNDKTRALGIIESRTVKHQY